MPNRNKIHPYALTARFTDQSYRRVIALSEKLGFTRHRTLQLCYLIGLDVLSGRTPPEQATKAVKQPAAPSAKEE